MKKWKGIFLGTLAISAGVLFAADSIYVPFGKLGYLSSSFGENRGTRYHAGIDYSTEMKEGFPSIAPEDGGRDDTHKKLRPGMQPPPQPSGRSLQEGSSMDDT